MVLKFRKIIVMIVHAGHVNMMNNFYISSLASGICIPMKKQMSHDLSYFVFHLT